MSAARQGFTTILLAMLIGLASGAAGEASPRAVYGRLPLSFEANHGQVDPSVQFVARSTGYQLFLTADEAVLVMRRPEAAAADALHMSLVGATARQPQGVGRLPGTVNYFTGSDPAQWRTSVPTYAKVLVPGVYPGIDLVYYGHGRQLEYDFILASGADPASIQLSIRGLATTGGAPLALDASGDLTLRAPGGEVLLKRPIAYQVDDGGQRRPVEVAYVLMDPPVGETERAWRVGFALGAYDRGRQLVIDPVVSYARYLGGTLEDAGVAVAVRDGEAYITGYTDSTRFPDASGSPLRGDPGGRDAFVAKLSVSGSLAWVTYLGGTLRDEATGIAVDATGVYITGFTDSVDYPTAPSPPLYGNQGMRDAFVTKLNGAGAVVYSTYLGGSLDDEGLAITVDTSGDAYVTGWTESSDFPTTNSAFQGDQAGRDAFATKLRPAGTAPPLYSTYVGGSGGDEGWGIAVDAAGIAYVTGHTTSTDLLTTANARATGGGQDAFVAKLDPAASGMASRLFLTYFGGSGEDGGRGIAVDSTGLIHVTGYTTSANFPTKFAYQTTHGGGQDAFVAKFNPAGTTANQTLSYSTLLGGSGDDVAQAIAVDVEGQAYIAGFTTSANFPTKEATSATLGGPKDAFVAKFDSLELSAASTLRYSTYLGSLGEDDGHGIALDAGGNAYVVGLTRSATFPGATGTVSGPADGFVVKLGEPDLVSVLSAPLTAGPGALIRVTDTVTNKGLAQAGASETGFYLSTDSRLTTGPGGDTLLGRRPVPKLEAGQEDTAEILLTLPGTLTAATYFLFSRADDLGAVFEAFESNNRARRTLAVGADLTVTGLSVTSSGRTLTVTETTRNAGGASVGRSTTTRISLSGPGLPPGGQILGSRIVGDLGPGDGSPASTNFQIPSAATAGSFTVSVRADADGALGETNETNNEATTTLALGADLVVSTLKVPSITGAGKSFTVTATTANQGAFPVTVSTTTEFFLSTTTAIDAQAIRIGTQTIGPLAAGANSGEISATVTAPAAMAGAGPRFIVARANSGTPPAPETNASNNTRSRGTVTGPDLQVTFVSPTSLSTGPGKTFTFKETTRNLGGGDAPETVTKFYLSLNAVWDASDIELGQRTVPKLAAGDQHFNTAGVVLTIPANTASNKYFLIARANAGSPATAETNVDNNANVTATIAISGADLVVSTLTVVLSGESTIAITDVTKNQGTATAARSDTALYLSVDGTLDLATDRLLGSRQVGELTAGAASEVTSTFPLPPGLPGTITIFAVADATNKVPEGDENNNRRSRTLDTRGSDLVVTKLLFSWEGQVLNVTDTTRNEGPATAGPSATRIYLSKDAIWDSADAPLAPGRGVVALAAASQSTGVSQATVSPTTIPGEYFLIAKADVLNAVSEVNKNNNILAVPITIKADLMMPEYNVPSTGTAGSALTVSGTVRNNGPIPAGASVMKLFQSKSGALDGTETLLATLALPAMPAGKNENFSIPATLPAGLEGTVSIIARIDANDQIVESDKVNNIRVKSVTVGGDLIISAVTGPPVASAGSTFPVSVTTRNQSGTPVVVPTISRVHLSTDAVLDAADVVIGTREVGALDARRSDTGPASVTIPAGTLGKRFIIAVADAGNAVKETREDNNTASFPIVIGPDLVVSMAAPTVSAGTITVTDTTTNQGGAQAGDSTTQLYLSNNTTYEAADLPLGSRSAGTLLPGGVSSGSTSLTVPDSTPPGIYYVIARADAGSTVPEADEDNNFAVSGPLRLGPDLAVSGLSVPVSAAPNVTIKVDATVVNGGTTQAGESVLEFFLTTDGAVGPSTPLLGSRIVPALNPGARSSGSTFVPLPGSLPAGLFQIVALVNGNGRVPEADRTNNTRAAALKTSADLQISGLTAPSFVAPGKSALVRSQVRNQGVAAGASEVYFYLSADAILDGNDRFLGSRTVPTLLPGVDNTADTNLTLPEVLGAFFIIAQANGNNAVVDAVPGNNTRSVPVTVGADFTIDAVGAPAAAGLGSSIALTAIVKNRGAASAASIVNFYLSFDEILGGGDILLGSATVAEIPAGDQKVGSVTAPIPSHVAAGTYYVIAKANADGKASETNPDNNTAPRLIVLGPDLVMLSVAAPALGGAGLPITIRDSVRNLGQGTTPASFIHYYLSPSDILDSRAVPLGTREVPTLAATIQNDGSASVTIPQGTPAGVYYLHALADATNVVSEIIKANNARRSDPIKIGPDLFIGSWSTPTSTTAGNTITVTATLSNLGGASSGPFVVRAYLSADAIRSADDKEIGSQNFASLAGGTSSAPTPFSAKIPAGISGPFTVILVADPAGDVPETLETNNVRTRALNVLP